MSEPALLANAKIGTRLEWGAEILGNHLTLLPENELVGLVRFSSMPRVLAPLTAEKSEVSRLLALIEPEKTPLDAQTNLVDALVEGLARVLAVPSKSQRIILWTDGEANVRANASGWSLDTVAESIRAFGVELVIIDGGPPIDDLEGDKKAKKAEAKALLAELAKNSGGKLLDPNHPFQPDLPGNIRKTSSHWSPIIRILSGWLLAFGGIVFWIYATPRPNGNEALGRSVCWSAQEIRAYRGLAGLASLGLGLGLAGMVLFFWGLNAGSQPKAILVDVQQGMLAGQPTRLEQTRSLLERSLQNPNTTTEIGLWVMGARPFCVFAPFGV